MSYECIECHDWIDGQAGCCEQCLSNHKETIENLKAEIQDLKDEIWEREHGCDDISGAVCDDGDEE